MNVRLIKSGSSPSLEKLEEPPVEIPILDTVQSWVREFQSTRADRTRMEFEQVSQSGKT